MKFLDLVKVYIKSGNGGSGALSFRREKYIEKVDKTEEMEVMEAQFGQYLTKT